jgi:hypothetical protein
MADFAMNDSMGPQRPKRPPEYLVDARPSGFPRSLSSCTQWHTERVAFVFWTGALPGRRQGKYGVPSALLKGREEGLLGGCNPWTSLN